MFSIQRSHRRLPNHGCCWNDRNFFWIIKQYWEGRKLGHFLTLGNYLYILLAFWILKCPQFEPQRINKIPLILFNSKNKVNRKGVKCPSNKIILKRLCWKIHGWKKTRRYFISLWFLKDAKINSNALNTTVFAFHLFEPENLSMLSSQKEIRFLLSGQTVIVPKVK